MAYYTAEIISNKKEETKTSLLFVGAGSRGRTDTVLLPSDFESDASANSTIPAWCVDLVNAEYYTTPLSKNQYVLEKK